MKAITDVHPSNLIYKMIVGKIFSFPYQVAKEWHLGLRYVDSSRDIHKVWSWQSLIPRRPKGHLENSQDAQKGILGVARCARDGVDIKGTRYVDRTRYVDSCFTKVKKATFNKSSLFNLSASHDRISICLSIRINIIIRISISKSQSKVKNGTFNKSSLLNLGLIFADAYADDDVDADAEADANAVMGGGHGRRKNKSQGQVV